ncbi:MAG: glycosyltransferase family 4 protein [Pseudomonadota bacterium]
MIQSAPLGDSVLILSKGGKVVMASVQTEAGRGGISRVARLTVRALEAAGTPVWVRALNDTHKTMIDAPGAAAGGNRLRFTAGLWRDALTARAFIYDHAGIARAHPKLPRRPYAVWMHGIEVWGDGLTPGRAAALRQADLVLVNSHHTLNRFTADHGPLPQARVCLLGTEEDIPPEPQALPTAPVALTFGRVDKDNMRKGHREVVAAWPKVIEQIPDARLLLAGGGDGLNILKDLVATSPAAANIEVLGFVPEADVPALWRRARLYVQPSWKEGFGLTYIEAMRHGIPVIASQNDAGQDVNADGVSGINVDLNQPEMLAHSVVDLLTNPAKAEALGRGAAARWADEFRFSAFQTRLMGALQSECGRRP